MAYLRGAYANEKTGLLDLRLEEKFLRRTKETDACPTDKQVVDGCQLVPFILKTTADSVESLAVE